MFIFITHNQMYMNNPRHSFYFILFLSLVFGSQKGFSHSFSLNNSASDSLVLVDFYNTTNGSNWTNNDNWLVAQQPISTWYGVTVDGSGCVVCLDFDGLDDCLNTPSGLGNNLTGTIPAALGSLSNLTDLYLGDNLLSGSIPVEIAGLSNLRILNFDNNQITGNIPLVIGSMTSLVRLNLGDNQLSGGIPDALGNLTNLQVLNLNNNQLSGSIPFPLGNLTNLQAIDLAENQLTGNIPTSIGNLINLEELYLFNNQLSGNIPSTIENLSNVNTIILSDNQLSGPIPSQLEDLENLITLSLNKNQLTGDILPTLGNLPVLQELNLNENQLSGTIPITLGDLSSLQVLRLNFNQLTGSIPAEFESLTTLTLLNLGTNQLSGTIPDELSNLSNLEILRINNNQLTGCYPLWFCDIATVATDNNPGFPNGGNPEDYTNFCNDPSTQFGLPCEDFDPLTIGETIQPDCSCATINSFTNFVSGEIFFDTLENCLLDNGEIKLGGWIVTATNGDKTYYDVTDTSGNYQVFTDIGTYEFQVEIPNTYWEICPEIQGTILDFNDPASTASIDAPIQANYLCPILDVNVGTSFLRRCFDNQYMLSYCNEGTAPGEDAFIEVRFDDDLIINGSTPFWTSQDGQTLTYELGDVPIGACGTFLIDVTVDCDSTILGQTHCVEARIFPDSICLPPNTLWDGSTVEVDARCEEDSIKFYIRNIGDNDMTTSLNYVIIQDHLILRGDSFIVPAGDVDSTAEKTNGATFRMEAEQTPFHPTNTSPGISVEGCAENGDMISLGLVNVFSTDDADPFVSIDCQENIGSFDPNDKTGYPKGLAPNNFIDTSTTLNYKIRFQNTGTDTAFTVVIRDTLSQFLNPASIKMGAGSHLYTWEISGSNTLQIIFENIMLPDSNINEVASHGFVKFKIDQQPNIPPGTSIENSAAIFFDFNEPIITNTTHHMIEEKLVFYDTTYQNYCDHWFYEQDTMFSRHSSFEYFEIFQTVFVDITAVDLTVIDTFLFPDIPYQGVVYDQDTTLFFEFVAVNGCDSIVQVNLSMLTNLEPQNGINKIRVSPNPSSGDCYLVLDLGKDTRIEDIEIHDIHGQLIRTIGVNRNFSEGQHVISMSVEDLPKGAYLVSLGGELGFRGRRLILY